MDQFGAAVEFFINVLGQSRADAERNAAKSIMGDAYGGWLGIQTPEYQPLGVQEQGQSELGRYTEDQALRDYQMQALDALGREVQYGGMTPEDEAAANRARQQAGAVDLGLRGAAEQQAAQRGMGGGMADYVGALQSAQAGTNRSSEMGLQSAADARQRYLQALNALSGQAGGMRGQEFGMASERARAQDAINRFNVGQRTDTSRYNQSLTQQDIENQMRLAAGRFGAATTMGGLYNQRGDQAERTAAKWGKATNDMMSSWGGAMGGGGGAGGIGGGGGMPW